METWNPDLPATSKLINGSVIRFFAILSAILLFCVKGVTGQVIQHGVTEVLPQDCETTVLEEEANPEDCNRDGSAMESSRCGRCFRRGFCLPGFRVGNALSNVWNADADYFNYEPAPTPFGLATNYLLDTQIENGKVAQLAFYNLHFDWDAEGKTWSLNRAGRRNTDKIVWLLREVQGSVKLESTGNNRHDESRKELVIQAFASRDVTPAVVVKDMSQSGLNGEEAFAVFGKRNRDFLNNNSAQSISSGGSSSAGVGGR